MSPEFPALQEDSLPLSQCIDWFRGGHIAVEIDMAAPVGPKLFLGREVVEARCIHVGETVFFDEIGEMPLEPFARIGETRCCRESRTGTDYDCIGGLKDFV